MPEATTRSRPQDGARPRARRAIGAVPAPLRALLGAVLLLGLAWALLVPPFQAPDEPAHVGYVQSLVEGPGLPGDARRPIFSTEQFAAETAANSDQTAANLSNRPEWSAFAWRRWQRRDATSVRALARSDGGGPNPAASNPPLFYLYDAVPYALAHGGDFFTRFTLMRLATMLWLLGTVAGAWLLAGEVFARDRLLQLVAAGVAGLLPMVTFVSAQVGPDGQLYALWTLALWLGVRLLKRGATPGGAAALLGVTGLAIVTKATSYALLPAALLALAIGLWRLRGERGRAVRSAGAGLAALLAPTLAWVLTARLLNHAVAAQVSQGAHGGGTNIRQFLSYLWQYYLPRLPFLQPAHGPGLPAFHIWIEQGTAAFGWLEVRFPHSIYVVAAGLVAAIGLAALARIVATRGRVDLDVAAFLLLAAGALLTGLHWTDFHSATPFMQGRYIFPLVSIGGLAAALALTWLRGTARQLGAGAALGLLFLLQLLSLGLVATRFYA
ncbi:MAG TPA: DUF2142 domain-containing protein [Conexibacter sp.]|nr:DUF2142 domain-containing protein [Conexibacter sp.]